MNYNTDLLTACKDEDLIRYKNSSRNESHFSAICITQGDADLLNKRLLISAFNPAKAL